MWCVTLREEHELLEHENEVRGRKFVPQKDEVSKQFRTHLTRTSVFHLILLGQ